MRTRYFNKKNKTTSMRYLNSSSLNALLLASATALFLGACQDKSPNTTALSKGDDKELTLAQMLDGPQKSEDDKETASGMKALAEDNLQLASQKFNTLLIDDPMNAHLHVLNGMTYQLMVKKGDAAKLPLAQAGFEQALKIDPHLTIAALQLGRIAMEQKDYIKAQECFSTVLLQESGNIMAQYELASASYQMGDLKTASMSIDRALKAAPNNPDYVRAGALIYAALGKEEQAQLYAAHYSTLNVKLKDKKHVAQRIQDWADLHHSGRVVASAQHEDVAAAEKANVDKAEGEGKGTGPAPATPPAANKAVVKPVAEEQPEIPQEIYREEKEDMVVIDAVIMRVSDEGTTSKGHNIMENFTLSLAPWNYFKARNTSAPIPGSPIFPQNNTANTPIPSATSGAAEALSGRTASTLITQGISFGTVNYSLNIANSGQSYVEIIGRPSLTATIGSEAKFFSGLNRHIAVGGQFGGNITNTPIGTTLNVTPLKVENGFITLKIEMIGSSITIALGSGIGANNATEFNVNKDSIETTVKMKIGESIMLAGITQRELSTSKNGFPILKDLPLIQYLFSEETTSNNRKSVMYVITPRGYEKVGIETKRYFAGGEEMGARPALTELELRHKDWYDPSINNLLILRHLGPVYGEYRTGDLRELQWDQKESVDNHLHSIASFLWY